MTCVQNLGNAKGWMERWGPTGLGKVVSFSAPTNGHPSYAPGCEWLWIVSVTSAVKYINQGSNTSAFWVEDDSTAGNTVIFGAPTTVANALLSRASGNVFADTQAAAGINPGATGADKIVAAVWIPAGTFDKANRGIVATMIATGAANNNSRRMKIILGDTNATFPALPAVDGSVTTTGGTVIGDSGALTTTMNAVSAFLQCQLFKRGANGSNTQNSMTTAIIGGGTHGGVGAYTDQTFNEATNLCLVFTVSAATTATDIAYNQAEVTVYN